MKERYLLTLGLLIITINVIRSQSLPATNEYISNKFALSKSFAGYYGDLNSSATYRANWLGFSGAPEYIRANFDMPMPYDCGLGLSMMNYKVGIFSDFNFEGAYSLTIPIQRKHVVYFGLGLQFLRSTIDFSKGKSIDIQDPFIAQNPLSMSANRLNSSMYLAYNWQKLYGGINISNLFKKELQNGNIEYPIHRQFEFFANYTYDITSSWEAEGFLIINKFKDNKATFDITAIAIYEKDLWFGLNWRRPKNFALTFGTYFSQNIYLNYTAGITGGPGFMNTLGSHEITLGYRMRSKGAWTTDSRKSNGLIEKLVEFVSNLFGK